MLIATNDLLRINLLFKDGNLKQVKKERSTLEFLSSRGIRECLTNQETHSSRLWELGVYYSTISKTEMYYFRCPGLRLVILWFACHQPSIKQVVLHTLPLNCCNHWLLTLGNAQYIFQWQEFAGFMLPSSWPLVFHRHISLIYTPNSSLECFSFLPLLGLVWRKKFRDFLFSLTN